MTRARTAYVLYLDDEVAGPAIEILARAIEPSRVARPHMTVVYSRTTLQDHGTGIFTESTIDQLTLRGLGTFDQRRRGSEQLRTLFFRCECPALEYLHHKPDYPDSFFHITLHDGVPSAAAAQALTELRNYPWDLDVAVPEGRLAPLGRPGRKEPSSMSAAAADMLGVLSSHSIEPTDLKGLDTSSRRNLLRAIADCLHDALPRHKHRPAQSYYTRAPINRARYHQEAFWPIYEFVDPNQARFRRFDPASDQRKGVFLTPPEIAFDIARAALARSELHKPVDFGDPALGSGVLFAAVVKLLGAENVRSAIGIEENQLRARLALERWQNVGLAVASDDFVDAILGIGSDGSLDTDHNEWWVRNPRSLILANPPYVRSQRLDSSSTRKWIRQLGTRRKAAIDSRSDLFIYFVLAAHDWLADGGIAAWLLPTEFMFTNYGAALREYLTHDVTLHIVHSYDGPSQFANARVTSTVVVFTKSRPSPSHRVTFSTGGVIANPYVKSYVDIVSLRRIAKWHFLADDGVARQEPQGVSIGDLFRVSRGLATGSNRHFVLDGATVIELGVPRKWLRPIVPRARHLPSSIIERDRTGAPLLPGVQWLIDVDEPLPRIRSEAPAFASYLERVEPLVRASTIVRRRSVFYKQERNVPPRFIFSYMARDQAFGRRFFLNRSTAIVLNNYLGMYPTPRIAEWLDLSPANEEAMLASLRDIEPSTLSRAGRVYVEGLTKVEPKELAGVSIPSIPVALRDLLRSRD